MVLRVKRDSANIVRTSLVANSTLKSSTLVIKVLTVACLTDFQSTSPPNRLTTNPYVNLLVSRSLVKDVFKAASRT